MSGQGHQFPGVFPNNQSSMRSNFGGGPMGPSMPVSLPTQLTGMMNTQMTNTGMVGIGTQMGQSYSPGMQSQLTNMPGIQNQTMSVVNAAASPNQGMGIMGMGTQMVTNSNIGGTMIGSNMGSVMTNIGINTNMGISNTGISSGTMTSNSSLQNSLNSGGICANTNIAINQNTGLSSQSNQASNQPQQNKEFNTASLCRFGQETVQDIVSRTLEVFQTLRAIQPPNGTAQGLNSSNEKKAKIQEQLRTIRLLFKRLRLIYEKCNENCQVPGMEYTHIESLIPLKEEFEHKTLDEKKTSEAYKIVCEENKELTEQVVLKNKHLKEVITNLRTIIWEINVMLTMRRS